MIYLSVRLRILLRNLETSIRDGLYFPVSSIPFASMQRQDRRKGGAVSRRSADSHKLIRYQRNGIARLSRAVRQG
jgi:hypothetical protein